jgi:hypothetical protein
MNYLLAALEMITYLAVDFALSYPAEWIIDRTLVRPANWLVAKSEGWKLYNQEWDENNN